jgi:hypothetical protein
MNEAGIYQKCLALVNIRMENRVISVDVWARNTYAVCYGRLRLRSWKVGN